ncbi:BspA family leucine-rich repeat surface protein [Ellagibacter isourolithinifaciens]|uniref:BspA family leucine-rich repeat surface protein n=1 Tax=Ellagibacter isourolithinifaciens TaxID=2137581 RepID=UPI003A8F6FC2
MKVLTGRSGCLGKGALRRKAKRRRGLPVVTGLTACALGVAVAAMVATAAPTALADEAGVGAARTQTESEEAIEEGGEVGAAVPDDPTALPELSADDGQVTVTVPTEVPCVMLGDGSVIGPATWSIENKSGKAARLANVHAERKTLSVEASASTKGGTALLDVSPDAAVFNQGFELAAGASADVAWSVAVTDDVERSEALSGALLGPTSLLTLSFTFAAVEDDPEPSGESAFAVFSADDASLTLYKRAEAPVEGTTFLGKEATRVYTGIENSRSTQPWRDVAERIASVSVADVGVAPKSLYAWFFGCSSLTGVDLRGLDTSGTTTMAFMFSRASALESLDLSMLDTSSCTDFSDVFQDCTSLKAIDMTGWDTSKGTTFAQMLFNCKSLGHVDLSPLDTSRAISFRQMLYGCSSLAEVDLSGFKTSKATTFASMLNGCSSLTRVDVTGFDLSSTKDLSMFFFNCKSLIEADLATTGMSKVTTLYGAFGGCSSLRSVDVSAHDVASVANFAYCFSGCAKLEKLDLSGWDASSARDVNHFLSGCASLKEVDLSGLHTEGVTDFSYFLYGCKSLEELDLTGISTASAKNGYGMFSGMAALKTVRLGTGFSWVNGAYLPLPSAAGVPGTDGKWHSLSSGKAYLPANVPCGVEDSYSALPPATAAAEEIVEPEKGRATGEGEGTGAEGAQKSMKEEAR